MATLSSLVGTVAFAGLTVAGLTLAGVAGVAGTVHAAAPQTSASPTPSPTRPASSSTGSASSSTGRAATPAGSATGPMAGALRRSAGAPAPPTRTAPKAKNPVIVALGDSVPTGSHCGCKGFVTEYAQLLVDATGHSADVYNDARNSATTATVRSQLSERGVRKQLAAASTVVIMAGANDYVPAFRAVSQGADPTATYQSVQDRVTANLVAIINTVRALHTGPDPVHIAVLDYWNVVKDGAVAERSYTPRQRAAAVLATDSANRAIAAAVHGTGASYVSTFDHFEGPQVDQTALLAQDGDHPSASGHRLIAAVLFQALPRG